MRLYSKRPKQLLALRVLELSAKGAGYRDIATALKISVGKVEGILDHLNDEAKTSIRMAINDRIPLEFEKSIVLLEYLLKRVLIIEATTKDERVRCQAIAQAAALSTEKCKLLSDAAMISKAIERNAIVVHKTPDPPPAISTTTAIDSEAVA